MRWVTGVAVLLAAVPVAGAANATPARTYRLGAERGVHIFEVYRATSAPRRLRLTLSTDAHHGTSTIQSIGLVPHRGGWLIDEASTSGWQTYQELGSGEVWPVAHGPASAPPCPEARLCTSLLPAPISFDVDSASPKRLTWFVTTIDTVVGLAIHEPGWRVRETHAPRFRRLLGEDTSEFSARTLNGVSIEHFTRAELPGGRYGSIAFAHIPCDSAGYGAAHLSGGVEEGGGVSAPDLGCDPLDAFDAGGGDRSYRATRWRLVGDVVGDYATFTRLAVFDFPKPPPG